MLAVEHLSASYEAVPALEDISFSLAAGECVALLGRNGVGKTTLLRTLMALVPGSRGRITLNGQSLAGLAPNRIARAGMALVPQGRGILGKLTVSENLSAGRRAAGSRQPDSQADTLALFPALREKLRDRAGTLSGGQQQQLALARALACRPSVLLLDEPSEGVQPNIVAEIGRLVRRLTEASRLAVLLVEQNVELALATADRCLVMEKGRLVHEGPAAELRNDAILRRYLAL